MVVRNISSLYADDLLIYVSNPEASAPVIVSLLNNFGSFSGYNLNYQKSECFPINDLAMQIKQESFPFHLTHSGFTYLGINITRSFTSLLGANFIPLNNQMKADFHFEQSSSDYCREGTIGEDERTPKVFVFVPMPTVIPDKIIFSIS